MLLPASPGPNLPLCAICGKTAIGVHMRPIPPGVTFSYEAGRVLFCKEHEKEALLLSTRPPKDGDEQPN